MHSAPSRQRSAVATMQTDHNSCPAQIKERHPRYQHLRRFCNGNAVRLSQRAAEESPYQCAFSSTPKVSHIASAIEFACVIFPIPSDTRTKAPGKYSQHLCQFFLWKGSRQRYHRTTAVGPVFLLHPVLHRKKALRKFQCKPDHRCQHHPHQCSRTAKCHRRGNAHDIACPDLCCQFRHQRCERRNTCFCWFPGAPRSAAKRCPKCKPDGEPQRTSVLSDPSENACPKQKRSGGPRRFLSLPF